MNQSIAACVSVLIAVCLTVTVGGCSKSPVPENTGVTSPEGSSAEFKKQYPAKQPQSKGP